MSEPAETQNDKLTETQRTTWATPHAIHIDMRRTLGISGSGADGQDGDQDI